jgi:hypothetical protein
MTSVPPSDPTADVSKFKKLLKNTGKPFKAVGKGISTSAKWAVSAGDKDTYKAGKAQIAKHSGMAVGAAGGAGAGYGIAHVAVTKTPLSEKMSEGAKMLTKKISAGVGAVGGAVGFHKLLPVIFKGLAKAKG